MGDYHEPEQELAAADRDVHRALTSLKEEIEAVDWYHQRLVLASDESLRAVLAHNRDEEIEHACLTLEWLRRHMPGWQDRLARYLFTEGALADRVDERTEPAGASPSEGSLRIGSLKDDREEEHERWTS